MTEDHKTYQRATQASLAGLGVQVLVTLAFGILAGWSRHPSLWAAFWHAIAGIPLWACLWIVYQQHRLERIEALEAEEIRKQGADSSIFEVRMDDLSVYRKRLAWLYRWMVPVVSLLASIYLVTMGVVLANRALDAWEAANGAIRLPERLGMLMAFCAGIAIVGFLMSRYLAGMARVRQWQLLRGGAAYLMGSVLVAAALVVTLALAHFEMPTALAVVAIVVPIFMVVIGLEIALNFVLDFYRPRRPGDLPRPAFDSRLLSLLTAPESIAKTINEAINYQFGFEITRSWFWQLLSRTFGWLVLFAVVVLLVMSCFVVVEPHQQALVTRWGQITTKPLEPGLHVKLPWPISRAHKFDVTNSRSITIGSETDLKSGVPILWTEQHSEQKPEPLLVAPSRLTAAERGFIGTIGGGDAPANSLMNAEVLLYYRIGPGRLMEYVTANADAEAGRDNRGDRRLRQIAEQEVSRALLQHDIDAWIGEARVTSGREIANRIQAEADERKLGIEVLSVVIAGVHPPQEVAEKFHEVVGAEQEKLTTIQTALQEAVKTLAEAAGSTGVADRIIAEIDKWEQMKNAGAPQEELLRQEERVEQLVIEAGGKAAVSIAEARAQRWEMENREKGRVAMFAPELAAYRAAPDYYRASAYFKMAGAMRDARKIIIVGDREQLRIRGDYKDTAATLESAIEEIERTTSR